MSLREFLQCFRIAKRRRRPAVDSTGKITGGPVRKTLQIYSGHGETTTTLGGLKLIRSLTGVISLCLWIVVGSAAENVPPPIAAFAKGPVMSNVVLSPNGQRLAWIDHRENARRDRGHRGRRGH